MNPGPGRKFDGQKTEWDLLPWPAVEKIVQVLMYGAKKYAPDNWKNVKPFNKRYFNAAIRHLTAWQAGEETDPESGFNHLYHAACNILFLIHGTIKRPAA